MVYYRDNELMIRTTKVGLHVIVQAVVHLLGFLLPELLDQTEDAHKKVLNKMIWASV